MSKFIISVCVCTIHQPHPKTLSVKVIDNIWSNNASKKICYSYLHVNSGVVCLQGNDHHKPSADISLWQSISLLK